MRIFKALTVEDIILGNTFLSVFDGEEGGSEGGNSEGGTEGGSEGGSGDSGSSDGGSEGGSEETTFTQEQVNTMLADQKRKIQTKAQDSIKQLENLKKTANLSKSEKENVEKQLSSLRSTMETEKQRAAREKAAQKNEYEQKIASLTAERDRLNNLYTGSTIKRSIADAASENKAIHNSQVEALLNPNTTLVEDVDAEGNPTGQMRPVVKFQDVDKDGNTVTVNYSPAEAVKRMTELPQYANLFESTNVSGSGRKNDNTGNTGPKDLKSAASSNESWLEERKKLGLG